MKKISIKEFQEKVDEIIKNNEGDTEVLHSYLDDLMENTLISLGYKDAIEKIQNCDRWYA